MTTIKMRTPPLAARMIMIRLGNDPKESSSAVAKAPPDSAVVVPAFFVGTVKTGRVVVEVVINSHST